MVIAVAVVGIRVLPFCLVCKYLIHGFRLFLLLVVLVFSVPRIRVMRRQVDGDCWFADEFSLLMWFISHVYGPGIGCVF